MSFWSTPEEIKDAQKKAKQLQQQFSRLLITDEFSERVEQPQSDSARYRRDWERRRQTGSSREYRPATHSERPGEDSEDSSSSERRTASCGYGSPGRSAGALGRSCGRGRAIRGRSECVERERQTTALRTTPELSFRVKNVGGDRSSYQSPGFRKTATYTIPPPEAPKTQSTAGVERALGQVGDPYDSSWKSKNAWYFRYFHRNDRNTIRIREADPWRAGLEAISFVRFRQAASQEGLPQPKLREPSLIGIEQALAYVTVEGILFAGMHARHPRDWGALWDDYSVPTSSRENLLKVFCVKEHESTTHSTAKLSVCRTCGGVRQHCGCAARSHCKRIRYAWPDTWGSHKARWPKEYL